MDRMRNRKIFRRHSTSFASAGQAGLTGWAGWEIEKILDTNLHRKTQIKRDFWPPQHQLGKWWTSGFTQKDTD